MGTTFISHNDETKNNIYLKTDKKVFLLLGYKQNIPALHSTTKIYEQKMIPIEKKTTLAWFHKLYVMCPVTSPRSICRHGNYLQWMLQKVCGTGP